MAGALAGASGLVHHALDQLTDVVGDRLDDAEDLLEHVAHQVRDRHAQILGHAADVLGELLGDARVQHALLAIAARSFGIVRLSGPDRIRVGSWSPSWDALYHDRDTKSSNRAATAGV